MRWSGRSRGYTQHRRVEILDAFLLLAPVDNVSFLKILRDPHHACHAAMVEGLTVSEEPGVIARLVELLRDTDAPPAALKVIACRTDRQFLSILLHEIKRPAPIRVLHNMRRLQKVAWLESHRQLLLDLDGRAQAVAVELATASDIDAISLSELLALLLRDGLAEGRRAACHALARFQSEKTNSLILAALQRSRCRRPSRRRSATSNSQSPRCMKLLVDRLDAPSVEVRDAARSSLAEFNFVRYRAMFDLLDDDAARSTGRLVHKVDQSANQKLQEELSSPSLSVRLRAIEMAIAMAATDDVQPQLSELAHHENVAVRKEAITALGLTHRPESEKILEIATHDPNGSVAEAARLSLGSSPLTSEITKYHYDPQYPVDGDAPNLLDEPPRRPRRIPRPGRLGPLRSFAARRRIRRMVRHDWRCGASRDDNCLFNLALAAR